MRAEVNVSVLPARGESGVQPVRIDHPFDNVEGMLTVPPNAAGMVVFAHSRMEACRASHNRHLVGLLAQKNLVVLEVGLLGAEATAGADPAARFESHPAQLTGRLVACAQWARRNQRLRRLPLGFLGFGLGGTVALMAGAALTGALDALVVVDGLPDLVGDRLANILAPTLLLISNTSNIHRRLYEISYTRLRCEKDLEVVPAARDLVNGHGRHQVGVLATAWLQRHLRGRSNFAPKPFMN